MSEDFMMADFDATRSMTYRADFEVNPIGTADEIKRLRTEARAGYDVIAVVMGDGGHHREAVGMRRAADDAIARVVELRADLERERMRLAACGVVALADTPESARQAREMHEDYRSASCDDVARRVDECMRLREKNEAEYQARCSLQADINNLSAELADAIKAIDRLHDERRELMTERKELTDVLLRNGFRRCDIPACNCGSWHHVGGFAERFREIDEVTGAEYRNGETLLSRIKRLMAECEALRKDAELGGLLPSEPVAYMVEMDGTVHFSVNDPRGNEDAFDNCRITPLYTRRSSHDAA